jgi:muramoyltetrapeptide carboxypeptidase
VSLASSIREDFLQSGREELLRLGLRALSDDRALLARESFFAGSTAARFVALQEAITEPESRAIFCTRGGYGSNYLLQGLCAMAAPARPKIFLGCSDVTSLQIFLWEKFGWVSFYGPMVAMNFARGAGSPQGYDRESLLCALSETERGWTLELDAETLSPGAATGVLLGGCLTLVETTLGTPWELQTEGAILVLEDRGMKPYAIDRSLMHLLQAGKFRGVSGILLGDFPDGDAGPGEESARDVARRILTPLNIPVVFGAPIGHTARPMVTLPLGVRAKLSADLGALAEVPQLEILEPACVP